VAARIDAAATIFREFPPGGKGAGHGTRRSASPHGCRERQPPPRPVVSIPIPIAIPIPILRIMRPATGMRSGRAFGRGRGSSHDPRTPRTSVTRAGAMTERDPPRGCTPAGRGDQARTSPAAHEAEDPHATPAAAGVRARGGRG
jgi:hypothetical protein